EFRDRDLADELLLGLGAGLSLHSPLGPAIERGFRVLAHFIGAKRRNYREPWPALLCAAWPCFRRGRRAGGARATCPRSFLFIDPADLGAGQTPRLGSRLFLAEALLGLLLGLALGFLIVPAALLLLALAGLCSLALGAFSRLALLAQTRLLLGDLAFLGIAQSRVGERMDASLLLFFREGAQHHPGRLCRCSRCGCACRRGRRSTPGDRRASLWRRSLGRGGFELCLGRGAASHFLDDDRLGTAMAEALLHHAVLDAPPFERQRFSRGDAQFFFRSLFSRFNHSVPNSSRFERVRSSWPAPAWR